MSQITTLAQNHYNQFETQFKPFVQNDHKHGICRFLYENISQQGVFIPLQLSITLKAETLAGRNFRESPKSRNFANSSFANFIL